MTSLNWLGMSAIRLSARCQALLVPLVLLSLAADTRLGAQNLGAVSPVLSGASADVITRAAPVDTMQPALVLIVRHAEKADNSNDPPLSAAGQARAQAYAEAMSDANVEHVIVTHRQRTLQTAQPLATARGLTAEVVPFGSNMNEHVQLVADAIRRQAGKVVLVVGHSNTVPMIVHALGGPKMPDLCDARYAALFAVVPGSPGESARVVVSSVGAPDAPDALSCGGMTPR